MLLGECESKCRHIAGVPLRPDVAKRLHEVYLAKGSSATIAIEGNTLTEEQVLQNLRGELNLPRSQAYLKREADNIIGEFHRLADEVSAGRWKRLTPEIIQSMNLGVLRGLSLAQEVEPGQFRSHSVGVLRYRGAPPEDCPHLTSRLCEWIESPTFKGPPEHEIAHAILQAVAAHVYLAWIHPFGDGNGRTARLVEFLLLFRAGVPAPAAHLLSNHYNRTRERYYAELQTTSDSGGDLLPFIEYAVAGFLDGLRSQLEEIREQVWDIAWRNFVHELFRDTDRRPDRRRRHLVLDLSRRAEAVPLSAIRELSARVAAHYVRVSDRTLIRDLNSLIAMNLVERLDSGYRAKRESILAFLPFQSHMG